MKTIAVLFTNNIEKHQPGVQAEGGRFEIPVRVSLTAVERSGDPWGYIKREIAKVLAHAVESTTVPIEFWNMIVSDELVREFNLPKTCSFHA